jgi:hypothetical protein
MTYVINKYNGETLVAIADRTLNTTATSIKLPGRDYPRYGEPVVEDLVWMLENFAGSSAPANPMQGQIWFDTNSNSLQVWNGSGSWLGTGKVSYGTSAPSSPEPGQMWYDSGRKQTFIYDSGLSSWILVGPMGAYNGTESALTVSPRATIEAMVVIDSTPSAVAHRVLRVNIGSSVIAFISSDATFSPALPGITGFSSINPGITLSSTLGLKLWGTATYADQAGNSASLNNVNASVYFRKDQPNIPTTTGLNLGSSGLPFGTVYSTVFDGVATSARYADLAERYHTDIPVDPGTVMCLGGAHEVTTSTHAGCIDLLGVVSTNPALQMNSGAGSDQTHPFIALVGRVPVKVTGKVCRFQRLMSSAEPGVACAWDGISELAILGRALTAKTSDHIELVEAVVGLK